MGTDLDTERQEAAEQKQRYYEEVAETLDNLLIPSMIMAVCAIASMGIYIYAYSKKESMLEVCLQLLQVLVALSFVWVSFMCNQYIFTAL